MSWNSRCRIPGKLKPPQILPVWRFKSPYSVWCRNSQLVYSLPQENSCSAKWKCPVIESQRPIMSKATKSYAHGNNQVPLPKETTPSSQEELSCSDQTPDPEVSFHQYRQPQQVPSMFMPYIEGPKMDWTVNDGLYHRVFKWHLKCENILECKLAALHRHQKCKKMIAWCGDFGMDQYVSWNLSSDELTLDTIWGKFEEFCKPQSNEVWAHFDLLTSFRQGNKSGWIVQHSTSTSQSG